MSQVAQAGTYTWNAVIRDGNSDLADSADLTLTLTDPDGNVLAGFPVDVPPIVHDSLGEYHYVWSVPGGATRGVYDAEWTGTVDGLPVGVSDSVQVVLAGSISPFLAYATRSDVVAELSKNETDARILTRIDSALVNATDKLTQEIGFDFFRHPSSGEGTWTIHGSGGQVIHAHSGIVSVSLIRVRSSRIQDWEELDPGDYDLEAWATADYAQSVAVTEPFDHIRLNGTSLVRGAWPRGKRLIELTGVRGWPAIPRRAIDANVDWARQDIAADRTFPGGAQAPDESGFPARMPLPDSVSRLRQWALYRYSCDT